MIITKTTNQFEMCLHSKNLRRGIGLVSPASGGQSPEYIDSDRSLEAGNYRFLKQIYEN